MTFDWADWFIPGQCLVDEYEHRLLIRGFAPLFLMVVLVMLICMPHVASYLCSSTRTAMSTLKEASVSRKPSIGTYDSDDSRRFSSRTAITMEMSMVMIKETKENVYKGLAAVMLDSLPVMLCMSFCLCPSVSRAVFSVWNCAEFTLDSATGAKTAFLRSDMSIECGTDHHAKLQTTGLLLFAIWPVGLPILYILLLCARRKAHLEDLPRTPMTDATAFLHAEYKAGFFMWEPMFMLVRLAVTGFVMMLFPAGEAIRRILFSEAITVVYMVTLLLFQPYRHTGMNFLAFGCQFFLCSSMQIALCMRLFNDVASQTNWEIAKEMLNFDGPSEVCTCACPMHVHILCTQNRKCVGRR
jgi:hypothetical protein